MLSSQGEADSQLLKPHASSSSSNLPYFALQSRVACSISIEVLYVVGLRFVVSVM